MSSFHEHSWFITCRRDMHGTTVLDCACGARKRVRGMTEGTVEVEVPPPRPTSPIGDVLFDKCDLHPLKGLLNG